MLAAGRRLVPSAAGGLKAAACSEWNSDVQWPGESAIVEDAGGPRPETHKACERRQKTGCGTALRTLSADAAGHCPLRAPAHLQRAKAPKDLRALAWHRPRGIRGVCMRATSCFLQCCGSRLPGSLTVRSRSLASKFVGGRGVPQLPCPTRATRHHKVAE